MEHPVVMWAVCHAVFPAMLEGVMQMRGIVNLCVWNTWRNSHSLRAGVRDQLNSISTHTSVSHCSLWWSLFVCVRTITHCEHALHETTTSISATDTLMTSLFNILQVG